MTRYADTVRDEFGRPVPGVTVYVYEWDLPSQSTGSLLSLTDDDLVTHLANPLTTDEFGEFYFNVNDSGAILLEFHYGGKLQYREVVRESATDLTLRTDLQATTGAGIIGTTHSMNLDVALNKIFGSTIGPVTGGVRGDLVMTRTFTAADSGSGIYAINNQINCDGSTNVGSVRALYSGANLLTTAGTCGLLSGAHFFTWMMGQGNVTTNKVVEAHLVAGQDSNGVSLTSPGTVTGDSIFFNTAGITLGTNIVLPKVIGYNAGQLTSNAQVVLAYGFNAEHNQSTAVSGEFMGFRSQVRNATGNWSFASNTNDGSIAAPAGFSGAVAIGANVNGATPVVPPYTLTVTSLISDYASSIINRNAANPFGLRVQYPLAAPVDGGHDFIHCDDSGATRFQVASNGSISIAGTKVLGPRQPGWTAATGTATRTSFATSTVTLAQLAQAVKALLDDLISHGIIGS